MSVDLVLTEIKLNFSKSDSARYHTVQTLLKVSMSLYVIHR